MIADQERIIFETREEIRDIRKALYDYLADHPAAGNDNAAIMYDLMEGMMFEE